MFSRRYTIAIADLKSGVERRGTVSLEAVLAAIGAVIMLLIAFGAIWKLMHDVRALSASHRALEIETSNYRAAIDALLTQIGARQSTVPEIVAESAPSAESLQLEPVARAAVLRGRPALAPLRAPLPASEPLPLATAIAPISPAAIAEDHGPATDAPARRAFMEALAGVTQTRASAEAVDAPALASRAYRAGVDREREAQELATAGRMTDALVRVVEADARFRAAEIEARAEAAASERLREPAPLVTDVEETILDVIRQYVRGLESRSMPTLKRVWPSLGGNQERAIQTEFENARTVQTLFTDPRITIDGDTTTVTGVRIYSLVTQDGQRLSSMTRTTMTLRRIGNSWVIDRIVHQQ